MTAELEVRVRELRAEIRQVEGAQDPVEDLLAREMARFDRATAQFAKEPYKRPFLGALSWERLEGVLMGMAGCLIDGSRSGGPRPWSCPPKLSSQCVDT
jgi:hypothetical protein